MSRNISAVEKVIILVLVMGAVLGAGFYFIVGPAYEAIGAMEERIKEKEEQIAVAEQLQLELNILKESVTPKRERAEQAHIGFYDEMTTDEAVTIIQTLLQMAADDGLIDSTGITVTDISNEELSLQLWLGDRPAEYGLREMAFYFISPEELQAIADAERINQIESDPSWNRELHVARFILGENAYDSAVREDAGATLDLINTYRMEPVLYWKDLTEMLLNDTELTDAHRARHLEIIRFWLATQSQEVGFIQADFEIKMTYEQCLAFLDYLQTVHTIVDEDGNLILGFSYVNNGELYESIEAEREMRDEMYDELTPEQRADMTREEFGTATYTVGLGLYILKPIEIPEYITALERGDIAVPVTVEEPEAE